MKKGTTGSASVHVDASPSAVYALVTDVRRMGEWSPECVKCEWVDGASGPAVGARFKGSNRRGLFRWSTKPEVVTLEPDREFSFATEFRGKPSTKWSYEFTPDGDGTTLTESFEMLADMPGFLDFVERHFMRIKDRRADLIDNMQGTITRIKAVAEGTAP